MTSRRRRTRGQALIEFALSLPIIIVLGFAGTDLGRAFYFRLPVAAAASAGARTGATADTNDIGYVVRQQSTALGNSAAVWGQAYSGGGQTGSASDCSSVITVNHTQTCGDPAGCVSGSAFWLTTGPGITDGTLPTACFGVRACTVDTSGNPHNGQCVAAGGCQAFGAWQSRPAAAQAQLTPPCLGALQITVTYRFVAATPLVSYFFSSGNALFEAQTATTMEQY